MHDPRAPAARESRSDGIEIAGTMVYAEERPHPGNHLPPARISSVTWIERAHHFQRRQDSLKRLTLMEFETIVTTPPIRRLTHAVR